MKKWIINYSSAWPYFKDHIEWGNSLSRFLIERIDFKKGKFFTFLPENSNIENLENLRTGGMLPSIPPIKSSDNGGYWYPIPTTDEAMVEFIKNFLQQNDSRYGLAEDVRYSPGDRMVKESSLEYLLYDDEVYYLLQNILSPEEMRRILRRVNAFYHLLIVLAEGEITKDKNLQYRDFEQIARDAKYIIGSAYDRESYIIWEKNE